MSRAEDPLPPPCNPGRVAPRLFISAIYLGYLSRPFTFCNPGRVAPRRRSNCRGDRDTPRIRRRRRRARVRDGAEMPPRSRRDHDSPTHSHMFLLRCSLQARATPSASRSTAQRQFRAYGCGTTTHPARTRNVAHASSRYALMAISSSRARCD